MSDAMRELNAEPPSAILLLLALQQSDCGSLCLKREDGPVEAISNSLLYPSQRVLLAPGSDLKSSVARAEFLRLLWDGGNGAT